MEKGLKGYRPLLLLLLCGGMTLKAAAQAAITDPLNTAQSTLTAGNTAATVKQVTESVNRLQTALDYVQKVSATVRRARMFTDLIDRQNRLNSSWVLVIMPLVNSSSGSWSGLWTMVITAPFSLRIFW